MTLCQKVITGVLIICVLFVGYYFVYSLPASDQAKLDLQQREIDLKKEKQDQDLENERKEMELKTNEQELSRISNLKSECETKGNKLKKEFSNISSVFFDTYNEECMVKSFDEKWIYSTSPIDEGGKVFQKPKPIPYYWYQTIIKWVNLRAYPPDGWIIQVIDATNEVYIKDSKFLWDELWYNITFDWDKKWWISSIAFWQ